MPAVSPGPGRASGRPGRAGLGLSSLLPGTWALDLPRAEEGCPGPREAPAGGSGRAGPGAGTDATPLWPWKAAAVSGSLPAFWAAPGASGTLSGASCAPVPGRPGRQVLALCCPITVKKSCSPEPPHRCCMFIGSGRRGWLQNKTLHKLLGGV